LSKLAPRRKAQIKNEVNNDEQNSIYSTNYFCFVAVYRSYGSEGLRCRCSGQGGILRRTPRESQKRRWQVESLRIAFAKFHRRDPPCVPEALSRCDRRPLRCDGR